MFSLPYFQDLPWLETFNRKKHLRRRNDLRGQTIIHEEIWASTPHQTLKSCRGFVGSPCFRQPRAGTLQNALGLVFLSRCPFFGGNGKPKEQPQPFRGYQIHKEEGQPTSPTHLQKENMEQPPPHPKKEHGNTGPHIRWIRRSSAWESRLQRWHPGTEQRRQKPSATSGTGCARLVCRLCSPQWDTFTHLKLQWLGEPVSFATIIARRKKRGGSAQARSSMCAVFQPHQANVWCALQANQSK